MPRSFVLLAFTLAACGGTVEPTNTPGDAGSTDTGTVADGNVVVDGNSPPPETGLPIDSGTIKPPLDGGGGACNDLANIGSVVDEINVPSALPTFTGGTIVSGTYVLVKNERYTGVGGASGKSGHTLKETIVFTPGIGQAVLSNDGKPDESSSVSWSTGGSRFKATGTCGPVGTYDFGYDATPTSLRLGLSIGGTLEAVLTFEKR